MSDPVTVTIARRVSVERRDEMVAWMQAGIRLASEFPGFLGAGWVRPAPESDQWHLLYRFDSHETLGRWDNSRQRGWWLGAGEPFVEETTVERRTGIEGWFDPPSTYDVEQVSGVATAPPRWKQTITIFLMFFPVSLLANWALGPLVEGWALPLKVLGVMAVTLPFMTYFGLPWITRNMEWFLHGRPAPWRRR
ncbi:antibiotic biosynthesis monooxygenase (ABM) superfamily enzyme [Nocardioides luteus]|uniref:Antibiotic biosynthesis monooxygenase n=1 Tax=Nocardioides luteus TaxID=1844 RepID=A0ABQ5SXA8_9ACTN|nr:antibiotic biosynthesis monooxygenase [Nocardioides luteus]MDR7312412.1 antibiotic biosynthesis monooxygenase (ABM) superfamily enzyme [Nocardioides luteus]GGR58333.1 antibiotic biosynthesis monooxygenase [Nocardioides luteus]GLJ68660.1 antibiotic biosynthesis monooxygenase [Nocardioides luteus]